MSNPTVYFKVDTITRGAVLGNKVSDINLWNTSSIDENVRVSSMADIGSFVETIQLMTATGGNEERDLFINPLDRSNLIDYNFSALISACRGILKIGAKPYIKTGNVPLKFTSKPHVLAFGVNAHPPDCYDEYYVYIRDIAKALVEEFGQDEVLTWRFGVLTEYENSDWYHEDDDAGNISPDLSAKAFFKLYDTTVAALEEVVGVDVCVGAHCMAVIKGLWDPVLLIEHCATTSTRICFLNVSFYDQWPGKYEAITLPEVVAPLRAAADKYGLKLTHGVDEGRLLYGFNPGTKRRVVASRVVGQTYQAAYDARVIKQMVDYDIAYFSAWSYSSLFGVNVKAGEPDSYPSVAFHVAKSYHEMCKANRLDVQKTQGTIIPPLNKAFDIDIDALASVDESHIYIMAYNFGNSLEYNNAVDLTIAIDLPGWDEKAIKVARRIIGDTGNFFPEWSRDREIHGIDINYFERSPDDPTLDNLGTLKEGWARDLYFRELRDKYVKLSVLEPETFNRKVENGKLMLKATLPANNVVFYTIELA